METKELMIGDWVRGTSGVIGRVKGISENDVLVKTIYGDTWADGEILPIPITPEIIEKNFESESNIFGLQTYKLNENFNLEDRGDRFCLVRKCNDYNSSTFWICDLTYLHQLQHALRLCGIEKEIVL